MDVEHKDASWSRGQFNLRMTKRRRKQLEEIAASLPASASAIDAIDHALDRACQSAAPACDSRIDGIEAAIQSLDERGRIDMRRMASGLAEVAKSIKDLRDLISAVADMPEDSLEAGETGKPRPFREWLEGALAERGMRAERSAIARAAWSAKSRQANGLLSLEFMADLISADGVEAPACGRPARVLFVGIGEGEAFADLDRQRQVLLRCAPLPGGGWAAQAFAPRSGGAPAVPIGALRI